MFSRIRSKTTTVSLIEYPMMVRSAAMIVSVNSPPRIVNTATDTILGGEFTLTIIAALLTIIGYSINDTVVVFDRIRENMRKSPNQELGEVINASINQTLSRTILTSFTVFLVLIALYFFGGVVIHDFAFILLVGVVFGTYSSVFIASPLVLVWESLFPSKRRRKK